MKKVSAIAWSSNGKKLAAASADKVNNKNYKDCLFIR
jgi:WD40 repeat protein